MKAHRSSPRGCGIWPLLSVLALTALGAGVGVVAAQEQPSLEVIVSQIDDADYPEVRLVVSVTDAAGRPLTGLAADDFRVAAGTVELPLKDVRAVLDAGTGIGVVLAIDVSGSMNGLPLERAKEVSREFVQQLSPADTVAVLAFSDQIAVTQGFTPDKSAAIAAIQSLAAGGNTALYNAVAEASRLASQSDRPRRAVLLLSDGQDYGALSSVSREGSIETARASGLPFFAVGLGSQIDQAYLQALAQLTGGRFFEAPAPDSLRQLFDSIATLLRSQYVLVVDGSTISAADGLSLIVTAESHGQLGRGERALPDNFFRPRVRLSGLPSEAIAAALSLRPQINAPRDVVAVQYFIDGRPVQSTTEAPFELPLDPIDHPAGQHELTVVVTDIRGDRGEAKGTIQIAAIPPRLNILNAQEGTIIRGRWSLELEIKSQAAVASVQVLIDGESLQADERGRFHLDTAPFSEGPHPLVVRAVDEAGGTSEMALTLELRHASGGGGGRLLLVLLIPGLVGVALIAMLWYRGRRRRRQEPPAGVIVPPPAPAPEPHPQPAPAAGSPLPADTPAVRARLTLADGPQGERVFLIAREPVTIGSDPSCSIVLADAGGRIGPKAVRIWLREDKFMLHRLSRRAGPPSVDPQPAWVVLESGDGIQVGPYRFSFEILNA